MNTYYQTNQYRALFINILLFTILFVTIVQAQTDMFIFGSSRPVADAGGDIKTLTKGSIFLDGSRSYIGDGSKIKYQWIFAPGLALQSDNDFQSEISSETYGGKFLKSVSTHKTVLNVKLADNVPGTKLEVILKIKDRIGFEDSDTLVVTYFDPSVPVQTVVDTLEAVKDTMAFGSGEVDTSSTGEMISRLLIQELVDTKISDVDVQIINSIIKDQIRALGFDYKIILTKDLNSKTRPKKYKANCKTDPCIANNAQFLNAQYALTWDFADSEDLFTIRSFKSQNYSEDLNDAVIEDPYAIMNENGIYGLEKELRQAVTNVMGSKIFKKDISRLDRLMMKNERWISLGKYPLMLGAAYLFIDAAFSQDSEEPEPELPPGFPHEP
jgi:hypothetical protein